MDVKEAYKVLAKEAGFEAGDEVRVLRIITHKEMGCSLHVVDMKHLRVGNEYIVEWIDEDGDLRLAATEGGIGGFAPFFCLELVSKGKPQIKIGEHTVGISKDGIKVGCTDVDWDTFDKIAEQRPK